MMTVAAIDRLVHHANLIEIRSDSYRRKVAMQQMDQEQAVIASVVISVQDKATTADPQENQAVA